MTDFQLVLLVVGGLLIVLAGLIVLEWRGFYARSSGHITISEYIHNVLFSTRKTVFWVGVIIGAGCSHFLGVGA